MDRPFVVLAAVQEEAAAVLRLVRSKPLEATLPTFKTCHELYVGNQLGPRRRIGILAQLAGTGRVHAAVATTHAIHAWRPQLLLIIGTAGGFKSNGVALGDVLVATEILDYESQKLGTGAPIIRWAVYEPEARLLELARAVRWPARSPVRNVLNHAPQIHFGPVLSGDKVIASQAALEKLLGSRPRVLGVEMEGAGVAFAARQVSVPFLMVRGVADHADDTKSEDSKLWSEVACDSVAYFVSALLESWVEQRRGD